MNFQDLLGDGGFGEFDHDDQTASNPADFMFGMSSQEIKEIHQQKDSVIFLIDCHHSMHQPNPHNQQGQPSNLTQILEVLHGFIKNKIIVSENDKIGIVLYGCGTMGFPNDNSLNFQNIHVLHSLDIPDANMIKMVEDKFETFSKDHGWYKPEDNPEGKSSKAGEYSLHNGSGNSQMGTLGSSIPKSSSAMDTGSSLIGAGDSENRSQLFRALWVCHQEFKKIEKQNFSKRIFLFTDCDSPGNLHDQEMAGQRAQDLEQLNVKIELFSLPNYAQMRPMFDYRKFYANIISFEEDDMPMEAMDVEKAASRLFDLKKTFRQKEFKKRIQGKLPFEITKGTKISMSFYTPILHAKKPSAQKVNSVNNKLLQANSKLVCQETGISLYKNQVGTFYPLGGEKVILDKEEVQQIKKFGMQGMQLMGFKPRKSLKVYHNISHSYFLFPDEKKATGSSQVSDALIKEMIAQDKIMIVKFIPRENSQVRFCALLPQEEKQDQDGFQTPPGFCVIPLPYADDIRDTKNIFEAAGFGQKISEPDQTSIMDTLSGDEKKAAMNLIKNMDIDFDSKDLQNPSIQQFFNGLQALALNEEEPEPIQDLLEPNYEHMKKRGKIFDMFRDAFFDGEMEDPECAPKAKGRGGGKRKHIDLESSQSSTLAKKTAGKGAKGKAKPQKEEMVFDDDSEEEAPKKSSAKNKKRKLNNGKADVDETPKSPSRSARSRSPSSSQARSPKKNGSSASLADRMKEAFDQGKLNKFTKKDLVEFLNSVSLPAAGTKPTLIALVEEHFES